MLLSVNAYIANSEADSNGRNTCSEDHIIPEPNGLACPNLEGRFPALDATRIPVSRSKDQRSRSSDPLMLTHVVHHIFRMARPANLTTTRISHRRHDLRGQRSRS